MVVWLPAILALLIATAGWHYLFYSRAAHRLGAVESAALNRRRVRMRRANGVAMLLLAACFYIGMWQLQAYAAEPAPPGVALFVVWASVLVLLVVVLLLAVADMRLTLRLRRDAGRQDKV